MGVGSISKSGVFSFRTSKFDEFVTQFELGDLCEVTKYLVQGPKRAQKWFVRFGENNLPLIGIP
jgi:hypothetical protein